MSMPLPSQFSKATTPDSSSGQDLCAFADMIADKAIARKMRKPAEPVFIVMGENHTVAEHQALQILTLHALEAKGYNTSLSMELTSENLNARKTGTPVTLASAIEKTYSASPYDRTLARYAHSANVPVYINDTPTYNGAENDYLDSLDADTYAAITRAGAGDMQDFIHPLSALGMQIRDDVMTRRMVRQSRFDGCDFMIVNCGTEHVSGSAQLSGCPDQSYDVGIVAMLEGHGANVLPVHMSVRDTAHTTSVYRMHTISRADQTLIVTTDNDRSTLQKTLSRLPVFEYQSAQAAPVETTEILSQ